MIEAICFVALILILLFAFIFLFGGMPNKKIGWQTLLIIAGAFILFSLFFKPESFIRWDLIEHFKVLKNMKKGGWEYLWKESQYADLVVYNLFAYLISLLPENCWNLLSTIPLIIDFLIITYIYKQIYKTHFKEANGKVRILSVVLWLFTFGMKLAITGIRCSLAVSIAMLAIFLEMIENRKKSAAIVLYAVSILIHNFALAIIFVRLLSNLKKPFLLFIGSLGISFALEPVSEYIVKNTSIEYLRFSFGRILATIEEMGLSSAIESFSGSTLAIYFCFVLVSVYLFFISWRAKKHVEQGTVQEKIVNLAIAVGAVAIGLSFNYLYLERFMYFLSYALFLMIPIHNQKRRTIDAENIILIPIALFLFFFNDIYIFLVNYVGFYFLAR